MAIQTYQLVLSGNLAGQFVQNVLHYRMDDDSFANRLLSAKALVEGWESASLTGTWCNLLPIPYTFLSAKGKCLTDGGGPEYISLNDTGTAGTQGAHVQTSSAGPVVVWVGDAPNRSSGKVFLPGIGTTNAQGGQISASFLGVMHTYLDDLIDPFPAAGGTTPQCDLCWVKAVDPTTRYIVTGYRIGKDLGQQRRRQLPV